MGARNNGLLRSSIGPIVTTCVNTVGKITKKVGEKVNPWNDLGEWIKYFTFTR
jgi:hypothetical protein